jgi:protein SCO1/2
LIDDGFGIDDLRMKLTSVLTALGLLLAAASWAVLRAPERDALPDLGQVPAFALEESRGRAVTLTDLAGRIWVADFIFTSCPGTCAILSNEMARLQRALAERGMKDVRSVSFSVDPANDSLEVLLQYAGRYGADAERWLFVTGERKALHSLIQDGFKLAVDERTEEENTDGGGLITHSDRFVLVDRDGRVRGYYHGTDSAAVDRLLADIEALHEAAS